MEPAAQPLILVIEDELPIAQLLCEVLEEHSYRCITASGGPEALRILESVRPALITLDLGLPGVNGRTLLHLIRARPQTRDIPVVIVSAERVIEPDLHAASQAVVAKPFEVDHLVLTVGGVLSRGTGGGLEREVGRREAHPPFLGNRQPQHSSAQRAPDRAGGDTRATASD